MVRLSQQLLGAQRELTSRYLDGADGLVGDFSRWPFQRMCPWLLLLIFEATHHAPHQLLGCGRHTGNSVGVVDAELRRQKLPDVCHHLRQETSHLSLSGWLTGRATYLVVVGLLVLILSDAGESKQR